MAEDGDIGEFADFSEDDDETECTPCAVIRAARIPDQTYVVTPHDGGGWQVWCAALLRLLRKVGHGPTLAMIISQPDIGNRYVQVLIGHGIAHPEASSNVYHLGDSVLSDEQHELLDMLGWTPPAFDRDDQSAMPSNWTLPLVHGDWGYLVEMLTATMIGIFGFSEHLPVEVHSFVATNPCASCSWGDELDLAKGSAAS